MPSNPYDPIKQNLLYPLDNPDYAIRNAMSDVGINPYSANPFAAAVGKLGRSMANSYKVSLAADNTAQDTNALAFANAGRGGRGSAMAFSDYLRHQLSPSFSMGDKYPGRSQYMAPAGNVSQQQATAGAYLAEPRPNGIIPKVRQYRNDLAAGTVNANNMNVMLAALSDQLGANGGLGTASFLADLYAPYLAPSMARAYAGHINAIGEQAIRRLSNDPLNTQNDIWTYMLGF